MLMLRTHDSMARLYLYLSRKPRKEREKRQCRARITLGSQGTCSHCRLQTRKRQGVKRSVRNLSQASENVLGCRRGLTRVAVAERGGAGEDAGLRVLAVALVEAVDGVGAVGLDGVRGEAGAALQDGLAVGAGAARVVQRLLQRAVRQLRAAHAPRAVLQFQAQTTRHPAAARAQVSEKKRLQRKETHAWRVARESAGAATHLSGRRARRPPLPAGRRELRPPSMMWLALRPRRQ
jgi:hypothetical protein